MKGPRFQAVSCLGLTAVGLIFSGTVRAGQEVHWPAVKPTAKRYTFKDAKSAAVDLRIEGARGQALYRVECRTAEFEAQDGFDYSGDFECRLLSLYSKDPYSTLLTDNPYQSRDWESRGRVLSAQLFGRCGSYPEYGRVRHFKLRGMRLTMVFDDVAFTGVPQGSAVAGGTLPQLRAFDVTFRVEPDGSAVSNIAEPVAYAEPPVSSAKDSAALETICGTVRSAPIRGRVQREELEEDGLLQPFPQVTRVERVGTLPSGETEFVFANAPLSPQARAFYLPIYDQAGHLAYEFECSAYTSPLGGRLLIGRWGVSCGLFAAGKERNLLADSVDPYSRQIRANILPEHLSAMCASDPDWGRTREFKLRGLRLALSVLEVRFAGEAGVAEFYRGGIEEMRLRVTAEPDPQAEDPIAPPPRGAACEIRELMQRANAARR